MACQIAAKHFISANVDGLIGLINVEKSDLSFSFSFLSFFFSTFDKSGKSVPKSSLRQLPLTQMYCELAIA